MNRYYFDTSLSKLKGTSYFIIECITCKPTKEKKLPIPFILNSTKAFLLKCVIIIVITLKGKSMTAIKLTTIGNSTGAVIPKEILEKLHVNKGDTLYLVEDEDGYRLTPYNEEFLEQMKVAEIIMREDRDVLKALAK